MKILQLRFQNINSLKGEHCINFEKEPLKSNSLFAIIGPTGSGKSSLLDVISLALFNEIPRLGKVSRGELIKTGAVITRHQKNAYAEVMYQCQAGTFLSHWDIQYNRNQKLNEYSMRIKNLQTNEELDIKRSEVPSQNEAFIGLSYQQFIKSILLAQGEFARFLKAADSERKQLLEQITGTEIYRKIGMLAFQKASTVKNELEKDLQRITDFKEELLSEDNFQSAKVTLNTTNLKKKQLDDRKLQLNQQKQFFEELKKFSVQLNGLLQENEEAKVRMQDFTNENKQKLLLHEKTQSFAEQLADWQNHIEKSTQLYSNYEKSKKQLDELRFLKETLLAKSRELLKLEVTWDDTFVELEEFRKKINHLRSELNNVRNTFNLDLSHLKNQTKLKGLELSTSDPTSIENILIENQKKWNSEINHLENELNKISFVANAKDNEKFDISRFILEATEAKSIDQQLIKLREKKQEITSQVSQFSKRLAIVKPEFHKKNQVLKECIFELENTKLQFQNYQLTAELATHRDQLKEGHPCPLCGATSHPSAHDKIDDEYIINFKEKIKHKTKLQENFENECKFLEKEIDQLQTNLTNFLQHEEEATNEILHLEKSLDSLNESLLKLKDADTWENCIEKLTNAKTNLEQLEALKELQSQVSEWLTIVAKLKANYEKGRTLRENKDALYKGEAIDDEVNDLKSSIDRCKEKEQHIRKQTEELLIEKENHNQQLAQLENDLIIKATNKGFSSIGEAKKARLKEQLFQTLKEKERLLKNELHSLHLQIESIRNLKKDIQLQLTFSSEEEVIEKLLANLDELTELEAIIGENSRAILNHQDRLKKVKKLEDKVENTKLINEKWLLLNEVIGDKTGKKFNDFAQDLSLKYLLGIANKRLLQLSNRYQIDRPTEYEANDLMIIDHDMGSERRSVKTLSGGETFVVSLALALALSDLASQNVRINSLFIDEGFGTLDPETLDQTLDTLERLQAETNKTIGIISHVDALKERIQTQIQLQKNGQGFSTLQVVRL